MIKLLVEAGGMKPGPALSQKLGPTGINVNQVIQKVNDATKKFAGESGRFLESRQKKNSRRLRKFLQ